MITYGFTKESKLPFEDAIERVTQELQKEGFGVLTSIDMKVKFREKLNIDFNKYVILGACNPPLAYESLSVEEDVGLLLPCNVIVYDRDGTTIVSIIKPTAGMGMIENRALREIAEKVEAKLKRVIEAIK